MTQDRLPPSREGRWLLRTLPVTAEMVPKRSQAAGVHDGPRRRARPAWQRHRDRSRGDLPKTRLGDRCSARSHPKAHTAPPPTLPTQGHPGGVAGCGDAQVPLSDSVAFPPMSR